MARPIVALPPTEREELQRYLTQRKLPTDLKLRIWTVLPEGAYRRCIRALNTNFANL